MAGRQGGQKVKRTDASPLTLTRSAYLRHYISTVGWSLCSMKHDRSLTRDLTLSLTRTQVSGQC